MHAIIPELKTWATTESPDVIAWRAVLGANMTVSVVVECKTSRADFLADRAKPFRKDPARGMGYYRWMFAPSGLLRPDEIPERWGLAELGPRGVRKRLAAKPFKEHNAQAETALLVAALRRVHFPDPRFPPVHVTPEPMPSEGEGGALEPPWHAP